MIKKKVTFSTNGDHKKLSVTSWTGNCVILYEHFKCIVLIKALL